jgi:putative oxidoreductase
MKIQLIISWVAQLAAAVILLQTLFFKFTGAAESVYIFSTLGIEPWGRLGSGVAELIAAGLLLWPRMAALGALLGLGVMAGAIGAHLTMLGIEVQGDGGTLFGLAVATALCCAVVIYLRQDTLWSLLASIRKK